MKRLTVLSFLFIVACSDSQAPIMTPQLQITAGNNQSAAVGKELPNAVRALLSDKDGGAPLPGRIVNWIVVSGNGQVFAGATETGPDGTAAQRWTLGSIVGEQRLVVRWVDPETGQPITIDTAKATATPDIAVQFIAGFGPNTHPDGANVLGVGDTGFVVYQYRDVHGNGGAPCGDGGSMDRVVWASGDPAILVPLGTAETLSDGRRATRVLAKAPGVASVSGSALACAPASASSGVQFTVR